VIIQKFRDAVYTKDTKIRKVMLRWHLINGHSFSNQEEAVTNIRALMTDINKIYGKAFLFESEIKFYDSEYKDYKFAKHKEHCNTKYQGTKCVAPSTVIEKMEGKNWKDQPCFHVLVVNFQRPELAGYGQFPWMDQFGLLVMSSKRIHKGATTLPHELGHCFGLFHIFRGVSEVRGCNVCYERDANDL